MARYSLAILSNQLFVIRPRCYKIDLRGHEMINMVGHMKKQQLMIIFMIDLPYMFFNVSINLVRLISLSINYKEGSSQTQDDVFK